MRDDSYFFLDEDIAGLEAEMASLSERIAEIRRSMGDAANQSSETWHDNAPMEEAQRDFSKWGTRLEKLAAVKERIVRVAPHEDAESVGIGSRVEFRDLGTGETRQITIGSYMVFEREGGRVAYQAPIAALLMGARAGQTRKGKIGRAPVSFEVLSIS